jgi:AcrR family transcriptional regulator
MIDLASEEALCGKAGQIVAAAREAFLDRGYDGVSMDGVAKSANVAKQTLYSHYASKDALFLAVVMGEQRRIAGSFPTEATAGKLPVRTALLEIGRRYLDTTLSGPIVSLMRLAIAEAQRFPQLAHSIFETGPKQTKTDLASALERIAKNGELKIEHPLAAAEHFIALIRGELHLHCLMDPGFRPSDAQIDRQLEAALDCFLACYGTERRAQ